MFVEPFARKHGDLRVARVWRVGFGIFGDSLTVVVATDQEDKLEDPGCHADDE